MPTTRSVQIDAAKAQRLLRSRTGPVARVFAGFAGLSTGHCRDVARERTNVGTGAYIAGISSTVVHGPRGPRMVTTARAPHSAILEGGSKPHMIYPRRAKVLRFQVGGKTVYARKVAHPGTRPYNILSTGVRRAARQLDRIAR